MVVLSVFTRCVSVLLNCALLALCNTVEGDSCRQGYTIIQCTLSLAKIDVADVDVLICVF